MPYRELVLVFRDDTWTAERLILLCRVARARERTCLDMITARWRWLCTCILKRLRSYMVEEEQETAQV